MRPLAIALAVSCALALAACGDTLQEKPIAHNTLETLLTSPFPVYWLGGSFHRLAITEATHDPGGAYSVQYGNCLEGGQGACVAPLRVITSADNGFVPGATAPHHSAEIRGVSALVAQAGTTVIVPTGPVVVTIVASNRGLARAAASTIVPINEPAAPGAPLPAAQPDSGYGSTPLASQEPTPLRPLR